MIEMQKNNFITKSVACLILVVVFYMHFCSALCAVSTHGCCGKEDSDNDNCCQQEKSSDNSDKDCQNMHFAFFNTTGQFSQSKVDISLKPFESLVALVTSIFNITPVSESKNIFLSNGFRPPPPKVEIRIFISSFQI